MRSQHKKCSEVFPSNNTRRMDVQAVIEAVVSVSGGKPSFVRDFILAGEFMNLRATREQYSRVAQQMADNGLLVQGTYHGDYCYFWWADVEQS